MGKTVVCGSCGAEFEENLAKCPHCGSMNLVGAEREYMDKLGEVREDMGELEDAPLEDLNATVKGHGRFLVKVCLVILVAVAALAAVFFWLDRRGQGDLREEYAWQQEYIPRLNQLYDEGNYDAMLNLALLSISDKNAVLWKWEHYNFYETYYRVRDFVELYPRWEEGSLTEYDYAVLFQAQWHLVLQEKYCREKYTDGEFAVLKPYIERAAEALASDWGMSEEEYGEFLSLAEENYYWLPFTSCEDFVKRWMQRQK